MAIPLYCWALFSSHGCFFSVFTFPLVPESGLHCLCEKVFCVSVSLLCTILLLDTALLMIRVSPAQVRCSPKVSSSSPEQSYSPPSISQSTMKRVTIRARALIPAGPILHLNGLKQHNLPAAGRSGRGQNLAGIGLQSPSLEPC